MQPAFSSEEIQSFRAARDRSDRETQAFLQHIVHDLRTVRRTVGISSEVLLGGFSGTASPQQQGQSARHIQDGLAKMDAILSGISTYSLTLISSDYSFGSVSAEMVIRLALKSLEKESRDAGAVITHSNLPQIVGDRDKLTNLFRNLIDNALKYRSPAAPQIEISAQQQEGNWLFSVRDNGLGIDQKHWKAVFVPFTRLHGSEIPGVGLGLAICRKIVEAHRGSIWLESAAGEGTTVSVTIPREPQDGPLRDAG
jgi:light-regulated signal transduction histidine kinase (bacteriophytochrome)